MFIKKPAFIFSLFFIVFGFPAYGKLFRSSYVEFQINYDWKCKSFGLDWVCHHYFENRKKPAFILITAKEGGGADDTDLYTRIFNTNIPPAAKKIHIKKITVNRHPWVDGFFQNIISRNIFSRYVATVCCKDTSKKIRVIIGFHTYRDNYAKYSNEFLKSIRSLKLAKNVKSALNRIQDQKPEQKTQMLNYIQRILLESDDPPPNQNNEAPPSSLPIPLLFVLMFLLIATGYYLLYSKKLSRKRRRRHRR